MGLLAKECSSLKARVTEAEGTMKETLESMDKLQANLELAFASNLGLEGEAKSTKAKSTKDQVALLQRQVLELPLLGLLSSRWNLRRQWPKAGRYLFKARIP